jgi:predicted NACHT family NTPase
LLTLICKIIFQSPNEFQPKSQVAQLSRLTVKQQNITNNRTKLREYAEKLIKALESNIGIVAERGLEVFGFQHLSFQEYFVAQSFYRSKYCKILFH